MCKYCKRLKELKELDEKTYTKIIRKWQSLDEEAEQIISDMFLLFEYKGVNHGPGYEKIHERANKWLDKHYN